MTTVPSSAISAAINRIHEDEAEALADLTAAIETCEVNGGVIAWDHPFKGSPDQTYGFAARWTASGWYLTSNTAPKHVTSGALALWMLSSTRTHDFPIWFATEWEQIR
jgi:hypothetical protein